MGFRSTFVTNQMGGEFQLWFVRKWRPFVHFHNDVSLPLASRAEGKTYGVFVGFEEDIQKAYDWNWYGAEDLVVWVTWMHECHGITVTKITKDSIKRFVPTEWELPYDDKYGHDPGDCDPEKKVTP